MRALIRCNTNFTQEEFMDILDKNNWIPSSNLSKEILDKRKTSILKHLLEDKRMQVKDTFKFMIYHNPTETWGIVNSITDQTFNIRFNNPSVDQIRVCCSSFVESFKNYSYYEKSTKNHIEFDVVDVQDDDGGNQFPGDVLHGSSRSIALARRRNEFFIANIAMFLFLSIELFTSPLFSSFWNMSDPWGGWIYGNLERLTPALLIICALSYVEIYWEVLRVRRESPIKWGEYRKRPPTDNRSPSKGLTNAS